MVITPITDNKANAETENTENTETENTETVNSAVTVQAVTGGAIGVTSNTFIGDGYEVKFSVISQWKGAFNGSITITNTKDSPIENWAIQFDMPNEISNIWNATVKSFENGIYQIKNARWNQDIPAGETVNFGFTALGQVPELPENYLLLGTVQNLDNENYIVAYNVVNDWGTGFSANIGITNKRDTTIEDWSLEFDFDNNISTIWNSNIAEHNGTHYILNNAGYNQNIEPGATVSIGFNVGQGDSLKTPENINLYDVGTETKEKVSLSLDTSELDFQESKDGDFYTLSSKLDKLSGTATGVKEIENIEYSITDEKENVLLQGSIEANSDWSIENVGFGVGYNLLTITAYTKNSKVSYEYIIINFSSDNLTNLGISNDIDTDSDEIPDYYEELLGLNSGSPDTDMDGLDDYTELFLSDVNPLSVDTDDDGITDSGEDSDMDGLTNLQEINAGTSLLDEDTDSDGLTDGAEIQYYRTDPLNADTDEDGLEDGWEVKIGSDPLIPEKDFIGTVTAASFEGQLTVPTVSAEGLSGDQVTSLSINRVAQGELADSEIPGFLDCGYEFYVNGTFDTARITFTYDESLLEDENFYPAVYYYNDDTQTLEELSDQTVENNQVTVKVNHFSKYILLNKTEFDKVWEYELLYKEEPENNYANLDVVFAIDSSGSMATNDSQKIRIDVTKEFINELTDSDRAAIVDFDSYAKVLTEFTSDKTALAAATDKINSSGGTSLSAGIQAAINLFAEQDYSDKNTLKYIIMLTDGVGTYSTSLTTAAADNNIIIYTIGLGSSISTSVLTAMAEGTGGSYYHASAAEQMYAIFDRIADESDLYKDTDGDNVCDYYEKEMTSGRLRLGTGVPVTAVNYMNPDSDNDNLIDGDEITVKKYGSRVYAYLYSNPTVKDTDKDGIQDDADGRRLIPDIPEALIYQSAYREGIIKTAKAEETTVADDLTFNDYTYGELCKRSLVFSVADITPEFMMWSEMAVLFDVGGFHASSEMKNVLDDMVDTFKNGNSSNLGTAVNVTDNFDSSKYVKYVNSDLTQAVSDEEVTKTYIELVKEQVVKTLSETKGNLSGLAYSTDGSTGNIIDEYIQKHGDYPKFTEMTNLSLAIAIHQFHGNNITVKDFKCDGNTFSGTILFHFYDHFGLDADDEINHFGFVDWFTLQHYTKFDGAHSPFITTVNIEENFSGTIQ